jgi:hypothetical protein
MFSRLKRLLHRRPLDEAELREDAEARLRAQQEWRAAEQRKSDDQRGVEGFSERLPYIHRP